MCGAIYSMPRAIRSKLRVHRTNTSRGGAATSRLTESSTARGQTNVTWSFRNLLGSGVDRGENRFPCGNERKIQESLRHGQRLS